MIWENLLTDSDGQYVEVQSGRLFNQAADTSTLTPFKHKDFPPYATDTWTEYWLPVKGIKGFVSCQPLGRAQCQRAGNRPAPDSHLAGPAAPRQAASLRWRQAPA